MTWREKLRPGSFRGVAFHTEDGDRSGGRRLAQHEFPGRDEPFNEDLGRAARSFQLTIYVLGADYMDRRDQLLMALEKPGPGRLVHHWQGEIDVVVRDYRQRESSDAGGRAEFTVTFIEQGANLYPRATANARSVIRAEAAGAVTASKTRFSTVFKALSKPSLVSTAAVIDVLAAADAQLRAARLLIAAPSDFARFTRAVAGVKSGTSSLIFAPGDLIDGLANSMRSLADMSFLSGLPLSGAKSGPGSESARAQSALVELQGLDLGADAAATPARAVVQANRAALNEAVVSLAAAEEARVVSAMDFDNADGARAARDGLADRLAARIEAAGDAGDDAGFAAFSRLRVAAVAHLSALARGLPPIRSYAVAETQPALVIANRVYGADPSAVETRAADIATRNRVRHPGFVSGGRALEIVAPEGAV